MNLPNRITPELVVCANFAVGLKLSPNIFGDGQTCGCPQTILAAAGAADLFVGDFDDQVCRWAIDQYGGEYAEAFRDGFDYPWDESYLEITDQRTRDGFTDGAACRKALAPTVYA